MPPLQPPAVQASKDLALKAVFSRSLKSAQSLSTESNVDLYSEDSGSGKRFSDLLGRSDIHAVIVALPIRVQPNYVRRALSTGKHVLSEKPIAENLNDAQEMIKWYYGNIDSKRVTWSVAENFRFLNSFQYARGQVHRAGRILGFRVRVHSMVKPGSKYIDGGVHHTAGLQLLLGEDTVSHISAYTNQNQKHLPPVDTVDASMKTKFGATGTLSISMGTSFTGSEWAVACEGGSVSISRSTITTVFDGKEVKIDVADEKSGVPPEVRKWGEALAAGERNEKQIPEEALADLELLENMLKSGEANGQPMDCILQI